MSDPKQTKISEFFEPKNKESKDEEDEQLTQPDENLKSQYESSSFSKKRTLEDLEQNESSTKKIKSDPNLKSNSRQSSNNNNNGNNDLDFNISPTMSDLEFTPEETHSNTIFLIGDDEKYKDVWNNDYVKLPCSKSNVYKVVQESKEEWTDPIDGTISVTTKVTTKYLSRWYLINTVLSSNKITDAESFVDVIRALNPKTNWDFTCLLDFFETEFTEDESKQFFSMTLPKVIDLALRLPYICPLPIPLLKRNVNKEIVFSQNQIASLMCNAFLCLLPKQGGEATGNSRNQDKYASINFNTLYSGVITPSRAAKLHCIVHYLISVTENTPKGNISFYRQVMDKSNLPDWEKSKVLLRDITAFTEGTIEDNGIGMLQVDFANKVVGGGVLGYGCVQEEIRFLINPELIMSRLFTSQLGDNECLIVTGAERFSAYKGYGDTFEWGGAFTDSTPTDKIGRKLTSIVAMDAVKLSGPDTFIQFSPNMIDRELKKAYCGFYDAFSVTLPSSVATGNWGCGVFGGDKHLKGIIQLIAASQASRDIVYYSFGDEKFSNELTNIVFFLQQKNVTVGQLYKSLWEYYRLMLNTKSNLSLFSYLDAHFS